MIYKLIFSNLLKRDSRCVKLVNFGNGAPIAFGCTLFHHSPCTVYNLNATPALCNLSLIALPIPSVGKISASITSTAN